MKKFAAVILSLLVAASMAGCGSAKTASSTAAKSAAKSASAAKSSSAKSAAKSTAAKSTASSTSGKKTFTVGFDAEYPPYGYMDDKGQYVGFDLDLAQAVCDMEGWELVKTPIDWDSKDMELNSGSIDCIWSGFTINGRENDYQWTQPYVDNSQVMIVSEKSGISSLADLKGKTVGVQSASAALTLLQDPEGQKSLADTFKNLQEFGDYNSAFVELQSGSIDAVAMDIGVANYQIKSRGDGFKILGEALNTEQYGVGFKKGNTALCDTVNADLTKLANDGTVAKLADKYGISDLVCLKAK